MRLHFIEACGFRGFRDAVRVDFGSGFTVISGRNGVGKSTLCDAIEFALIGAIEKYTVEKAAQESLQNYYWWRGSGTPSAHYVRVGFVGDDGHEFTITRSREKGSDRSPSEIESALCTSVKPEDAVRQLCRTSIIRDEWIAALSLDLTETERFELVRTALGPAEGGDYGTRANDLITHVKKLHGQKEAFYQSLRDRLTDVLSQVSAARGNVAEASDVAEAMAIVVAATASGTTEMRDLLAQGRQVLARRRAWFGPAGEAVQQGREIRFARKSFSSPEAQKRRAEVSALLEQARTAKENADQLLKVAELEASAKEAADAVATSLAALVEHGRRLGLHEDSCPLCAAARTPEEFANGLAQATTRMEKLASGIAAARAALSAARTAAAAAASSYSAAEKAANEAHSEESRLVAQEQAHIELFERSGIELRFANDPEGLEAKIADERSQLINLERGLRILEASQAVSRLNELEERAAALRNDADQAAKEVETAQGALETAQAIEKNVRRVTAEIIDERLALISPLLNELYERLRPHADWRTIEYSIRGDIKRFLTLRVGDGLNPQFVFSSGQRRAAGLAFLLSVHLARAWSRWDTLVLDDPVQHIDDFRALHLVEVLAAVRARGRQIVCAVEDSALADLLCRRLSTDPNALGVRYDIEPGKDGKTAVAIRSEIPPMAAGVLRRGVELKTAS